MCVNNRGVYTKKGDVVMSAIAICLVSGLFYQGMQSIWHKENLKSFQAKKAEEVSTKKFKNK